MKVMTDICTPRLNIAVLNVALTLQPVILSLHSFVVQVP